jgi:hypothetical protein
MLNALKALLHSRKFLLALIAVLQILVVEGLGLPNEVWQGIAAILMFLVGSIAHEDAAAKGANVKETFIPYSEEEK